ncbi:MAG: hypothetical protein ACJ798_01910 [Phenylobacterium sp.]
MRLRIGLAILAAAGAASAAEPDPAKLAQARSLVAEAVALDRAEAAGRVPRAYAQALRENLVDGLDKLKQEPGLAGVVQAALADLRRRDTAALAALRDRLVAQERSHGRAD